MDVDWKDETAIHVIAQLRTIAAKSAYTLNDVEALRPRGTTAKCDFAIPSKTAARILIEAKGYGATGSKMSDILGDIHTIIGAKCADTALLFFTDGLTWKERQSDLRKLVALQNNGEITRIYTYAMADQFEMDLNQLKSESGL